jgi:Transglycosylase-like domain
MRKPIRAVAVPVVIVTASAGAAGHRAQSSGSGRRLDELSKERPAAATHFPIDGALAAANKAAEEARWIEGSNARQPELFLHAAAENEALEAQRAQSRKAPARTGRGGGGGGSCNPESIVQRESKGDRKAVNPSSGAGGKYQFLPSRWSGYGGYSRAEDAPESVQDERFNETWAGGDGSPHWGC